VTDGGSEPLLVVTNRLPFAFQRTASGVERRHAAGGLASALDPVPCKRGGTWIGWPGIPVRRGERLDVAGTPYRTRPIPLSENEVTRYYHGLSNRVLWPVLHSLVERASFDRRSWPVYRQVNQRFAQMALAQLEQESDLVWAHDYHLMLTPLHLRRRLSLARIGFFLHVPFPPYDIFRAGRVRCGSRETRVGAFPIGIDYGAFEGRAHADGASAPRREQIVLGADRLDDTKGIPERILAVERLLEKYPEHRERVVLLQIAVPSRHQVTEYRALKREIEGLVGRVNGRFGTASGSPIQYLYRNLDPERLAVAYRDADVTLVTPLRDGMNLVAKEFVACQTADPGVLVLSQLAGAAETMREALRVNPYDLERTADQVHRALTMPTEERRSRMKTLQARERAHDVHAWVASFLEAAPGA